jgi:hypothetical protein
VTDNAPTAARDQWKDVPGDDYNVSKVGQTLQGMGGRVYALPPKSVSRILAAVLPEGEPAVTSLHVGRLYYSQPGLRPVKLGFAEQAWPFVAVTRSQLFLFYVFQDGSQQVRKFLDLPLDAGVTLSPYARGRFELSWNGGLQLQVIYPHQQLSPYRSRTIRALYAVISEQLKAQGQIGPAGNAGRPS